MYLSSLFTDVFFLKIIINFNYYYFLKSVEIFSIKVTYTGQSPTTQRKSNVHIRVASEHLEEELSLSVAVGVIADDSLQVGPVCCSSAPSVCIFLIAI